MDNNTRPISGDKNELKSSAFKHIVRQIFVKDWALKLGSIVAAFVFWLVMSIS